MSVVSNLTPGQLDFAQCKDVAVAAKQINLDASARAAIDASVACVNDLLADGETVYGINTGFGKLASCSIANEDLTALQRNIILSHAAGVGEPLSESVVRLCLLLKANSLARGYSGVRYEVIQRLLYFLNESMLPVVPAQGSVGASGDLAPLSHLVLPLIGEGKLSFAGEVHQDVNALLASRGLEPLILGPKEGLALINGTQVSTSITVSALLELDSLFKSTLVAGALTTCAVAGNDKAFDARLHHVRGQIGQQAVAQELARLLAPASHAPARLQDPYSIRCQPQVMGACFDAMQHAATILQREINAVTDNPLLFTDTGEALSGGNFHAEPVAFIADHLALVIAEIGSLSERRLALMLDTHISGLPPFLVSNSGLCSGFMIAQVTAAALVSENKQLATPASVDSIPTSANQEDHVSMATHAGMRLLKMLANLRQVIAIEFFAAAQACTLIDNHAQLPANMQDLVNKIAQQCGIYQDDSVLADKMATVAEMVQQGELERLCALETLCP